MRLYKLVYNLQSLQILQEIAYLALARVVHYLPLGRLVFLLLAFALPRWSGCLLGRKGGDPAHRTSLCHRLLLGLYLTLLLRTIVIF